MAVGKEIIDVYGSFEEARMAKFLQAESEQASRDTGKAIQTEPEPEHPIVMNWTDSENEETPEDQYVLKKRKRDEEILEKYAINSEGADWVKRVLEEAKIRGISFLECESLIVAEEAELREKDELKRIEDENLAKAMADTEVIAVKGKKGKHTAISAQRLALDAANKSLVQSDSLKEVEKKRESALERADIKRLNEAVLRRLRPEKITKLQIRKRKNKSTPTLVLTRQDDLTLGESIEFEEINLLGYEEWVEVHELAMKSQSAHREIVLKEFFRRFDKIRKYNIDVSKFQTPTLTEEEQETLRATKRRKLQPFPQAESSALTQSGLPKLTPQQMLDRMSVQGGINDLSKMNLTPPPGAPDEEGLLIREHGYDGLLYHDHNNRLCFQRAEELHLASPIHLFNLKWICSQHSATSGNFLMFILDEARSRGIDLNKPESVIVKEEFIEQARRQW